MKKYPLLLFLACTLLAACTKAPVAERIIVISENGLGSENLIADSIIYNVDIVSKDTLDDWSSYRLRNMNSSKLIEEVFENVYSGQLKAFDYFTDAPLSPEEVRKKEESSDYARGLIEQLQFEEIWLFSPEKQLFYKQVNSFVFAYALYSANGELRGYKPVFRIKLMP